jgi:hypothetical protein
MDTAKIHYLSNISVNAKLYSKYFNTFLRGLGGFD